MADTELFNPENYVYENLRKTARSVIDRQLSTPEKSIELTEQEKFALCFVSGIEIEVVDFRDYKLKLKTKYPCGIAWDGEKFLVVANKNGAAEYSYEAL